MKGGLAKADRRRTRRMAGQGKRASVKETTRALIGVMEDFAKGGSMIDFRWTGD